MHSFGAHEGGGKAGTRGPGLRSSKVREFHLRANDSMAGTHELTRGEAGLNVRQEIERGWEFVGMDYELGLPTIRYNWLITVTQPKRREGGNEGRKARTTADSKEDWICVGLSESRTISFHGGSGIIRLISQEPRADVASVGEAGNDCV